MNNVLAKLGVFTLCLGVTCWSWAGPCKAIAMSCMQNGYYKGGETSGKGLIKDCVLPVVTGSKILPNTNFTPEQLQQCRMVLAQKMKGMQQQGQQPQGQQPQGQQPQGQQPQGQQPQGQQPQTQQTPQQ